MAKALLGGGCFWCLEAIFKRVKGVKDVVSVYAGCKKENPTYKEVCSDITGCAEAVLIEYDENIISFEELLKIFFAIHDPTQLNRQGADIGTQYRSVIFPLNEEQKKIAKEVIKELNKIFENKIVTTIEDYKKIYLAEDYHQNYYDTNPHQNYCKLVIAPKIEKFKNNFKEYIR